MRKDPSLADQELERIQMEEDLGHPELQAPENSGADEERLSWDEGDKKLLSKEDAHVIQHATLPPLPPAWHVGVLESSKMFDRPQSSFKLPKNLAPITNKW